jgi:hypothetical protein
MFVQLLSLTGIEEDRYPARRLQGRWWRGLNPTSVDAEAVQVLHGVTQRWMFNLFQVARAT